MTVDLSHERNFNMIYLPLFNSDKRFRVLYGGRDSGKSDFVAQWAVVSLLTEPFLRMLLVRKYERSIFGSQFQTIVDYINMWKLQDLFKITLNPLQILCKANGNFVRTRGLDNPDSALSTKDPNAFWYEEADQISLEAFWQTSASARTSMSDKIYEWITLNPRKKSSWVNSTFFPAEATYEKPDGNFHWVKSIDPDSVILHTTYKDNLYCSEGRIRRLESFKNHDENYYRVNTLGLWGGALKGLIYPSYQVIDDYPSSVDSVWGLDYGYNRPSALVKVGCSGSDLFLDEKFYNTAYSHQRLALYIKNHFGEEIGRGLIIVDSAEPALIKALKDVNLNAIPSVKQSATIKTVYDGIMYVKQYNIFVTKASDNIMKEMESYSWKTDKDGKVFDDPVKVDDHLMDAFRYPVQTYGIRNWRVLQNSVILDTKTRTKIDKFKGY